MTRFSSYLSYFGALDFGSGCKTAWMLSYPTCYGCLVNIPSFRKYLLGFCHVYKTVDWMVSPILHFEKKNIRVYMRPGTLHSFVALCWLYKYSTWPGKDWGVPSNLYLPSCPWGGEQFFRRTVDNCPPNALFFVKPRLPEFVWEGWGFAQSTRHRKVRVCPWDLCSSLGVHVNGPGPAAWGKSCPKHSSMEWWKGAKMVIWTIMHWIMWKIQNNSFLDHVLFAAIIMLLAKHCGKNTHFETRQIWVQIPASNLNPNDTAQITEGLWAAVSPFVKQRSCPPHVLYAKLWSTASLQSMGDIKLCMWNTSRIQYKSYRQGKMSSRTLELFFFFFSWRSDNFSNSWCALAPLPLANLAQISDRGLRVAIANQRSCSILSSVPRVLSIKQVNTSMSWEPRGLPTCELLFAGL